jgi:DNA-binding MarR family transcriptional regulator
MKLPQQTTASARPDPDLEALGTALDGVAGWIRRVAPRGEFNSVAMSVLDAVATGGPQRVSELVERERITQPGMTSVVNRLTEAGLVTRGSDAADRRAVLVAATPAGHAYLGTRHAVRASALADQLRLMSPQLQAALHTVVDELNALGAAATSQPTAPAQEH